MVLNARGKLITHLCGHEAVGDALAVEIVAYLNEVQTYIITYDVHSCTAGQRRIHVHHTAVEPVAGIGGVVMLGRSW